MFDFKCETEQQKDLWVECLKFLNELQMKTETVSVSLQMARTYFKSLPTFTSVVHDERWKPSTDGQVQKESVLDKIIKPPDQVKFSNIDSFAYAALT